jgi:hypothetical protein
VRPQIVKGCWLAATACCGICDAAVPPVTLTRRYDRVLASCEDLQLVRQTCTDVSKAV